MRKTAILILTLIAVVLLQSGCNSTKVTKTGFLSDYSDTHFHEAQ